MTTEQVQPRQEEMVEKVDGNDFRKFLTRVLVTEVTVHINHETHKVGKEVNGDISASLDASTTEDTKRENALCNSRSKHISARAQRVSALRKDQGMANQLGYYMKRRAISFLRQGLIENASKIVDLTYEAGLWKPADEMAIMVAAAYFEKVRAMCMEEKKAVSESSCDKLVTSDLLLANIVFADSFLLRRSHPSRVASYHYNTTKMDPTKLREARARKFKAENGITAEVIQLRTDTLKDCIQLFEESIHEMLEKEDWKSAWACFRRMVECDDSLHGLDLYWNPSAVTGEEIKTEEQINQFYERQRTKRWTIIGSHIAARFQQWEWFEKVPLLPNKLVNGLTENLQYLHHLSRAEYSCFRLRDLDATVEHCHKAIKASGPDLWGDIQYDVLYLLAQALKKQGLAKDSTRYHALIEDEYNDWRIYGERGRIMKELGFQMTKGKLEMEAEELGRLLNWTVLGDPALRPFSQKVSIETITEGLFEDDLSWAETEVKLSFRQSPTSEQQIEGNVLHLWALAHKEDLLKIAFTNPQIKVNQVDRMGRTPLHWVATRPSASVATLLLSHGAKVDEVDDDGRSPLHELLDIKPDQVLDNEFTELLKVLLKAKPTLTATTIQGSTPLHLLSKVLKRELKKLEGQEKPTAQLLKKEKKPIDKELLTKLRYLQSAFDLIFRYLEDSRQKIDFDAEDDDGDLPFDRNLYINSLLPALGIEWSRKPGASNDHVCLPRLLQPVDTAEDDSDDDDAGSATGSFDGSRPRNPSRSRSRSPKLNIKLPSSFDITPPSSPQSKRKRVWQKLFKRGDGNESD